MATRLPYLNKVRFQNMIFDQKPFYNGEKFGTTQLSSIYAINQESGGQKSQMVRPLTLGWNTLEELVLTWKQVFGSFVPTGLTS